MSLSDAPATVRSRLMAKREVERQRRHHEARRRRAAKARAREVERRETSARRDASRPTDAYRKASDPLSFNHPYENGETVFGQPVPEDFLVARIASYDWREAFIR